MPNNHYLTPFWRRTVAIVSGVAIVLHGRSVIKAITSPSFYLASAVSITVALTMIYIVHRVTVRLDRRAPWRIAPGRRAMLQLLLGLLLPAAVDLTLIWIFFAVTGRDMFTRGFFLVDFPIILMSLLSLNILYFGLYLWALLSRKETELHYIQQRNASENADPRAHLKVTYYRGKIDLDVRKDVICFYRDHRKEIALTVTGQRYVVRTPLAALAERYEPVGFCQINPSAIVNLATVQGYDPGMTRRSLQVLFKSEFLPAIGSPNDKKYRVTEDKIQPFLSRYQQKNTGF